MLLAEGDSYSIGMWNYIQETNKQATDIWEYIASVQI